MLVIDLRSVLIVSGVVVCWVLVFVFRWVLIFVGCWLLLGFSLIIVCVFVCALLVGC